ncbi:MAG TPA: TIM-barrel domain-containing protein, partial [Dongiaceae bacterium]|nr:TIM-barrel domain-containing protein [Dongiaceae bacterium]
MIGGALRRRPAAPAMGRLALPAHEITALAIAAVLTGCGRGAPPPGETIRAGHVRFTVITPECVRIEHSPQDRFIDAPSIFAAARAGNPPVATRVTRAGHSTRIDTGRIQITFVDDGAPPGAGNLRAVIAGGKAPIVWTPGERNAGNLGGALRGLGAARGPVDLGEGILSRDGWYLKDDSKSALLTADGWVMPRPEGAGDDWYLFGYGADYAAGLRALGAVSGGVPLPRRAFLGSWYSRYWPLTSADYKNIVEEYRTQGFPLDIVVFDTDWHRAGWTGWSWNRDLLPDAEGLIGWLHGRGLLVTLNLHPSEGVAPHEDAYAAFMRALGADPGAGGTLRFDDTDRRYMQALLAEVQAPLERAGIDFFWVDWQQQPNTRIPGLTHLAWLNEIYYRRAARDGRRGQILSRFAGLGDQRNVGHFSGDANALWPVLQFEVPATAAAGNAGAFFWSHDIGGHRGGRDPEMLTRWVQFGALSAALRLHAS